MSKERKSIFVKLTEYKSNPINEYNKICKMLNVECYYNDTIKNFLEMSFKYSESLRKHYVDLNDCLNEYESLLISYSGFPFENLDSEEQEKVFDAFLTFCEIIIHLLLVAKNTALVPYLRNREFKGVLFDQLQSLINNSLNSLNHDIGICDYDTLEVVVYKINPEAEAVAAQSSPELKYSIIKYLGVRENNINEKETILHQIIDLLETTMKKYSSLSVISKIKEYVQLIRHPEAKKNEKQYQWYFENKSYYLDSIFMMCIFVKEYDITTKTIKEFDNMKITSTSN